MPSPSAPVICLIFTSGASGGGRGKPRRTYSFTSSASGGWGGGAVGGCAKAALSRQQAESRDNDEPGSGGHRATSRLRRRARVHRAIWHRTGPGKSPLDVRQEVIPVWREYRLIAGRTSCPAAYARCRASRNAPLLFDGVHHGFRLRELLGLKPFVFGHIARTQFKVVVEALGQQLLPDAIGRSVSQRARGSSAPGGHRHVLACDGPSGAERLALDDGLAAGVDLGLAEFLFRRDPALLVRDLIFARQRGQPGC